MVKVKHGSPVEHPAMPRTLTKLLGDLDLRCDAEEAGDGAELGWKK